MKGVESIEWLAGTMGFMSSVHACVGYRVMPSTVLTFFSASGDGQTSPVGLLLALPMFACPRRALFANLYVMSPRRPAILEDPRLKADRGDSLMRRPSVTLSA